MRGSTASARAIRPRRRTAPSPTSTSRAPSSSSSRSPARSPTGPSRPTTKFTLPPTLPRGRPRDQRVAPARHRHLLGARDPAVVQQRRRRQDRHEDGQGRACSSGSRPSGSASRPASTSPARSAASSARSTSGPDSSIGNIPMGQGIAVTPHPDGRRRSPRSPTTAGRSSRGWSPRSATTVYDKVEKHRVIPGKVAREVREMLAAGRGRGHRHRGADPGLRGRGQDGHRARCRCRRQRLRQGRLRRLLHRHGARRPPAAGRPVRRERHAGVRRRRPRRRRSRRSCSTRSSAWRSRRDGEAAAGAGELRRVW